MSESSDSEEEEVTTVRKPAFVFDDSDADDSDADDDNKAAVTAAAAAEVRHDDEEESDEELNKNERKRNFNKKKKKSDEAHAVTTNNEKDSNFEAISIEEFSKLISAMEVDSSLTAVDEKVKSGDARHHLSEVSTLLNVDIRGLDIDSIMRRRFGGMAVNELPEDMVAAAAGGAQRRRFAAAVAGNEKVKARIAKLSNKVRTSCYQTDRQTVRQSGMRAGRQAVSQFYCSDYTRPPFIKAPVLLYYKSTISSHVNITSHNITYYNMVCSVFRGLYSDPARTSG